MTNYVKMKTETYMNFFQSNCSTNVDKIMRHIEGTCTAMCPADEVNLRKKENMVHILEAVNGQHKLVKRYTRPAADTNLAVAHNLRPFNVLKKTLDYLLFEVTKRSDVNQVVIYNFVTDRLRAVRQDMIIQDLQPKLRIILLEPMIRFHTFYGYLLCEESENVYSSTLNRNFLLECLKTCLHSYDEVDKQMDDIDNLISGFTFSLDENHQQKLDRGLVEAIYVLTNLYNESPMWRLRQLKDSIRNVPIVREAYRIAIASLHGNYAGLCKSIDRLCPLTLCAVALFLPKVLRTGVQVMSVAYRGRGGLLEPVCAYLRQSAKDATATLRHYGVYEDHGNTQRPRFNHDATLLRPRKIVAEHLDGKMNIDYILTYTRFDR